MNLLQRGMMNEEWIVGRLLFVIEMALFTTNFVFLTKILRILSHIWWFFSIFVDSKGNMLLQREKLETKNDKITTYGQYTNRGRKD